VLFGIVRFEAEFQNIPIKRNHQLFTSLNISGIFAFFVLNVVQKINSILAALVILVSSTGTTVAFHYCGEYLQDIAVFGKANPCCEGTQMPAGCCHDEKVEIKSDTFNVAEQVANTGFVPFLVYDVSVPLLDFSSHFLKSESNFLTAFNDAQPPAPPDIIILVQSFLI
jgi:hypothetical protein